MRIALAAAVLAVALVTGPAAHGATRLTSAEAALLRAVNGTRSSHGLQRLKVDAALTRAARYHSQQSLRIDRLEHGDFATRIRSFDARGAMLGENLAWANGPYARAGTIVRAWMNSPGHRANLLRPGFARIGLGAVRGRFQGWNDTLVVTADFAG